MKDSLVEGVQAGSSDTIDVCERALFPSERYANKLYVGQQGEGVSIEAASAAQSTTVLIVFDEARECLENVDHIGVSKFRMIHQALRELSTDVATRIYNVMSVFIDTSPTIQNFSPALEDGWG